MIEYIINDALQEISGYGDQSFQFIHLDDAWARPKRNGAFSVTYPTHPFDESDADFVDGEPGVTTDLTVVEMLDACRRVLKSGGVLAVDTDDYLLPKVMRYFSSEWSETSFAIGQTTALTKGGTPDRSTPGMYGSTGGYATVLAWRDSSPVPNGHPCRQNLTLHCPCDRQREDWGWGTVKPLEPFLNWIRAYVDPGDRVLVPCAGTAPAAVATEREYGDKVDVICIDVESEAKAAYERRRKDQLNRQETLGNW